jgi:hypothetical protein
MPHVDDGTLNALLDGELASAEAAAAETHIAACPACAQRLAEAKRFLAEATDLLGVMELPQASGAAEAAARRVPKTAREVALDLDGATRQSPAIRPNLAGGPPSRAPGRPPTRRRLDFTTLAWAATVVLAIGVGYLANEVRHTRQNIAFGEGAVGRPVESQRQASPAAQAQSAAPAAPRNEIAVPGASGAEREQAARRARASRSAGPGVPSATGAALTRKETPVLGGKQLAAGAPTDLAARPPQGRAAKAVDVVGGVGAAAERPSAAVAAAEPSAVLSRADRNAAAPAPRAAFAAVAEQRLATFRSAELEEAVARLGGSIRLIDGMRIDHVEVGPGWRVPGAARNRDVVRIVYVDDQGRRVVLDQQRIAQAADTSVADRQVTDVGMEVGDTLTTGAPDGQVRVRWVDRERFWLSLTASLPADSARALVGRVR